MPDITVHMVDIGRWAGRRVWLRGWLSDMDQLGQLVFLHLRDGSGFAQAVVDAREVAARTWQEVGRLTRESCLAVGGEVHHDARANGGYELRVQQVKILQLAAPGFPRFSRSAQTQLLRRRHLWLRSPRQQAIMRVRAALSLALRAFLAEARVVNVDLPLLVAGRSPVQQGPFELDYFGDRAYLATDWGPHLTAATAALGQVYAFGPVLRAGPGLSGDDLTETWRLEMMAAFTDLAYAEDLAERLLEGALIRALDSVAGILVTDLKRDPEELVRACRRPLPRDGACGDYLQAVVATDTFHLVAPDFHGWFLSGYQHAAPEPPAARSQREVRSRQNWPEDLNRFGAFPVAGFRLEFERWLAWVVGAVQPWETVVFPRTLSHLAP